MARFSTVISALADPTRRDIFERLALAPQSVGALAQDLPISRPAVSQHLRMLKEAGLVTDQAQGTRRIYHIDPAGLGALRQWLDLFWDQSLAAFQAEADKDYQDSDKEEKAE
jgi:DNA-binding transcriptional ArsR family regulator